MSSSSTRVLFDCLLSCSPGDGFDLWSAATASHIKAMAVQGIQNMDIVDDQHVICSIPDKAQLALLSYRTGQVRLKFTLSEAARCVAVAHDGQYIAAGTASGKILLWNFLTGELIRTWVGHYKAVNQLRFALFGSLLISGGDDAIVHAWAVKDIVKMNIADDNQYNVESAPLSPHFTLSDHSLSITHLLLHATGLLFSAAHDKSVKVFDLAHKTLVANFILPTPVLCIAVDDLLNYCYAGGADGNIYCLPIQASERIDQAAADANAQAQFSHSLLSSQYTVLAGHTMEVASLSLNFDCTVLVSASLDGSLKQWNCATRICMKTMKRHGRKSFSKVISVTDNGVFQAPAAPVNFPILRRNVTGPSELPSALLRVNVQANRGEAKRRKVEANAWPIEGEFEDDCEPALWDGPIAESVIDEEYLVGRPGGLAAGAAHDEAADEALRLTAPTKPVSDNLVHIPRSELESLKAELSEWKRSTRQLMNLVNNSLTGDAGKILEAEKIKERLNGSADKRK